MRLGDPPGRTCTSTGGFEPAEARSPEALRRHPEPGPRPPVVWSNQQPSGHGAKLFSSSLISAAWPGKQAWTGVTGTAQGAKPGPCSPWPLLEDKQCPSLLKVQVRPWPDHPFTPGWALGHSHLRLATPGPCSSAAFSWALCEVGLRVRWKIVLLS